MKLNKIQKCCNSRAALAGKASRPIPESSPKNRSIRTRTVALTPRSTSLRTLPLTSACSAEVQTPQWSFPLVLTLTNFSKPTRGSTTRSVSSSNEPKQQRSSSRETLRLLRHPQASKISTFKLISLCQSLLIRLLCMRLAARPNSKCKGHQLLTRCPESQAFQKRL